MPYHLQRRAVWNLSCTGWRLSGDLPLRIGEICSLTVNLPNQQHIMVAEAVVRWVRQNEYGIETITIQKHTHQRLQHFISDRLYCAGRGHGRIRF